MTRLRKPRWLLSRLGVFRRNRDGSTAVEFGMIALPFFAIVFAIAESGIAFLCGQFLDRSVEKASRSIFTGQVSQTSGGPTAQLQRFKNDVCGNITAFLDCNKLYYDVQAYQTFGNPTLPIPMNNGTLDTSMLPRFNPGAANQIVVARVYYLQPIYADLLQTGLGNMSGGNRLLVGTAVFKNEPF